LPIAGYSLCIAMIDGDTAIFKPEAAEEECQIILKFTDAKLVITQTGICGFGHNVTAAGTYKKFPLKRQSSARNDGLLCCSFQRRQTASTKFINNTQS
jgi:hypothetical protein